MLIDADWYWLMWVILIDDDAADAADAANADSDADADEDPKQESRTPERTPVIFTFSIILNVVKRRSAQCIIYGAICRGIQM